MGKMGHKTIFAIAFTVALLWAFSLSSCSSPANPVADLAINHNMTVQKFSGSNTSIAVVSGSVTNNGAGAVSNLSINVTFSDQDGKTLDQATAVTSSLPPGGIWNFSVQSKGPDAWKIVNYKVTPSLSR
jgi:hypothetical protein